MSRRGIKCFREGLRGPAARRRGDEPAFQGRARRPWRAGLGGLGTVRPTHGWFMGRAPAPSPAADSATKTVDEACDEEGKCIVVEEAKTSRSKCRKCREVLPRGGFE